jgi:hypothetical protein
MTRTLVKMALGALLALAVAGCVYEPAPYYAPAPSYGYYPAPAYYYGGPSVSLGFGYHARHWR